MTPGVFQDEQIRFTCVYFCNGGCVLPGRSLRVRLYWARCAIQPGPWWRKQLVTLLNQDTAIQAKATTDESGNFLFSNVKVGRYTVSAEAAGFSKAVAKNIQVDVNARQRVDLTLQVGAVTESVQVTDAAAAIEDASDAGELINTHQVAELPP